MSRANTDGKPWFGPIAKKIIELPRSILDPIGGRADPERQDIGLLAKLTWGITAIIPLVPFLYLLMVNDFLQRWIRPCELSPDAVDQG